MTPTPVPFKLAFPVPGAPFSQSFIYQMIEFGTRIRDCYLWQYPILPGAVKTFLELTSTREWRLSGKPTGAARALEALHNSVTYQHDGLVDRGFEQLIRRWVYDYLCIGRVLCTWDEGKPLRYLDPSLTVYDLQRNQWFEGYTQNYFDADKVIFHHPLPVGIQGYFVSPLSFILPTAMMAWLIQQHDMADADGRKVRDIIVIKGEELAKQFVVQMRNSIEAWNGADPTKLDLSAIWMDAGSPDKAGEVVARVGLANIPEGFDREKFLMQYVNEIAAALGLALRHFYTGQENGTNRSLEEVQEARQQLKGPAACARSIQRMLNQSGYLRQFGKTIRFGIVEEVDLQSLKTRATVLKEYAQAFAIFVKSLGGVVKIESLVAWLQSDGILPADLEIIESALKNAGVLQESDPAVGTKADEDIVESDPVPSPNSEKSLQNHSALDYGEVSINQDGKIVERRNKIISLDRVIIPKPAPVDSDAVKDFNDLLIKARETNMNKFVSYRKWQDEDLIEVTRLKALSQLQESDYRSVKQLLDKHRIV